MRHLQAARGTPLTHPAADPADPPGAEPRDTATRTRRPQAALALTALAIVAADVGTKVWAVSRLSDDEIRLFGGLVVLHEQRNPGAAFSLGGSATVLFSLVAIGIAAVIIRTARTLRSTAWALALGLILGGAVGNLVDRLLRDPGPLRGHVVDFIDLHWNGRSVWPVFNVADMAIVSGAALALLLSWRAVPLGDGDTEA